jgi:DNA modification methylase
MLIWAKNNHVLGRCDFNYKHEPILYGWVEGAGHRFYGGDALFSVWEIDRPSQSKLHPTMKPVELFAKAMGHSSKSGDLVCDPFLGSGTTLIASEQLDRTCYGIEVDPGYCDVIVDRWEQLTGGKAKRA